jgi:hypothetical protein
LSYFPGTFQRAVPLQSGLNGSYGSFDPRQLILVMFWCSHDRHRAVVFTLVCGFLFFFERLEPGGQIFHNTPQHANKPGVVQRQ